MTPGLRVYRSLDEVRERFGPCALSIGNFDGVHSGHRSIFRRVVQLARRHGWKPAALTFDPHPTKIVAPERAPRLLTTPEQRCSLMREEGIGQVLILPFHENIARLTPEDFVREILITSLDARAVLVGANFRFGHRQAGDTKLLERLGQAHDFLTEVVPAVGKRGQTISSSVIRRLITAGSASLAWRLLERPHFLDGDVVPGHGVGSSRTVPTLNLRTEAEVLPAGGVYITRARDLDDDRTWPSVTNVGYRPTFGGTDLSVETFLLTPLDGAAPGRIRVQFLCRLREERKFPSAEELKTQILRDARRAKVFFRRLDRWLPRSAAPSLIY
jgi:riboflavin kinase/FMN adenylyltransferase